MVELVDGDVRQVTLAGERRSSVVRTPGAAPRPVVLDGVEPHLAWRDVRRCILHVVERLALRRSWSPSARSADAVPHTRLPLVVGSTASPSWPAGSACPRRRTRASPGWSACSTPSSRSVGVPTISLRVGVPHYLTHAEHPLAVGALLAPPRRTCSACRLDVDLDDEIDRWADAARRGGRRRRPAPGLRPHARGRLRPPRRGDAPEADDLARASRSSSASETIRRTDEPQPIRAWAYDRNPGKPGSALDGYIG